MNVIETTQIELRLLKTFPGNPRRGDIELIRESLRVNGQFRPIVIRRYRSAKTHQVLAGNHTFLAAKAEGWASMLCTVIRCSDAEARRIVAVDNRTAQMGSYDADALAELLEQIRAGDETMIGTGYDASELDGLLADLRLEDVSPMAEEPVARLDQRSPVVCPHCHESFIPGAAA